MIRALLLALLFPLAALAQNLPPPISAAVNDFADLLPPEAEERVAETLRLGREETGVHVVLVTMDSMARMGGQGEPIEEYAKALFNFWGVGDAKRNDGILVLVSRDDREMRIALGAGYPVIWDNAAQRVIDRYMLPDFRQERYADGIENGIPAVFDLIARPFVAGQPVPEIEEPISDWNGFGAFMVFVGMYFVWGLREKLGNLMVSFKTCPNCGKRSLTRTKEILEAATRETSGRGVFHITCSSCGTEREESFKIPRKSRRESSSSSGFGGGSSSGGGASGKW